MSGILPARFGSRLNDVIYAEVFLDVGCCGSVSLEVLSLSDSFSGLRFSGGT